MSKEEIFSKYQIGGQIKVERKSLGLRQADLAKMTRLPASHLSDIERGASIPTIPTLYKIGMALDRPLEYFFQEANDHPRSLGMVFNETSLAGKSVLKFAEMVKKKSNGEVNLHIYHQASLGSTRDQVTSLSQGGIHLFSDTPISFEYYAPIAGPVFLPYFFNDRRHYHRFVQSNIFRDQIYMPLLKNGIRLLDTRSHWTCGDYELLFSTTPVFSPEDLKGKRIRTYDSRAAIALREEIGAIPVTVEWENVFSAFKNNEIDIFLCPSSYFESLKLHKIVKYATLLRYGYTLDLIIAMSEKEYAKLSPGVQKALISAVGDAGIFCSELANNQTETDLENLSSKYGIPVIQPDYALWRSTFRNAILKICQDGLLDLNLYETIQKI